MLGFVYRGHAALRDFPYEAKEASVFQNVVFGVHACVLHRSLPRRAVPISPLTQFMTQEIRDITIIGGGPTGLFAPSTPACAASRRRSSTRCPSSAGSSRHSIRRNTSSMWRDPEDARQGSGRDRWREQAAQFHPADAARAARHRALKRTAGHLLWSPRPTGFRRARSSSRPGSAPSHRASCPASAEVVRPRDLRPGERSQGFRGQRFVIIGGGDSAFDWAHAAHGLRDAVTLVHRSDRFRAHGATVRGERGGAGGTRARAHLSRAGTTCARPTASG